MHANLIYKTLEHVMVRYYILYAYMCACAHVCMYVCLYMYMYMYMYMYIYTYMYIHINMCTYTSTNAYKLIYIYIYIYIVQICCLYIYIHIICAYVITHADIACSTERMYCTVTALAIGKWIEKRSRRSQLYSAGSRRIPFGMTRPS